MAKYLQRSCPKCNGYLGIVIPQRKGKMPVQAINKRWLKCGHLDCVGVDFRDPPQSSRSLRLNYPLSKWQHSWIFCQGEDI
jgi:hypothetical protein